MTEQKLPDETEALFADLRATLSQPKETAHEPAPEPPTSEPAPEPALEPTLNLSQPVQPAEPAIPAQPAEPAKPAQPAQPAGPFNPAGPGGTGGPASAPAPAPGRPPVRVGLLVWASILIMVGLGMILMSLPLGWTPQFIAVGLFGVAGLVFLVLAIATANKKV